MVHVNILQAVQGNPPNRDTGRVGAVGHIHFICMELVIKQDYEFINHMQVRRSSFTELASE